MKINASYIKLISIVSIFAVIALIVPNQAILAANANLKISGIVRSYSTPNTGDSVRFDVYILNNGQALANSSNVKFRVDSGNNGSYENTFYQGITSISAGDSKTVSFNWTPSVVGYYGVEFCADSSGSVAESSETDNCVTQSFNATAGTGSGTPPLVITPPPANNPPVQNPPPTQNPPPVNNPPVVVTPPPISSYVNLKITGVVRSYTTPKVGDNVRFDIYIKNDGNISSANSITKLRIDFGNNGSYETTLDQVTGTISAGSTKTVSFGWTPSSIGTYKAELCADSNNSIVEFSENDNCSTQTFNVIAKTSTPPAGSQNPIVIPPQIIYLPGQTPAPIYIQSPSQSAQVIYLPGQTSAPVYVQSANTSPQIIYYPGQSQYSASSFFQATADLSVTDVTTNPKATDIVAGKPVTVSASIKNNSNIIRAEPSQVSFRVDDNSSASADIFYTQTIDFIQPGDYRAVSFTWTPTITGNHKIEICADYTNNITEYDEANNCTILYTNTNSDSVSYLPRISMYSSPVNISKGGTSSLIWNSNNTTGCYASDGWSGYKSTSGSETIYPENSRNYTITCYNSYGQNSATASVFVGNQAVSQNFVASCITDPASTSIGRQVVFAAGQAGAKGDVTYTWSGDVYGTGILKKVSFDSSGIKTAIVTVKDDAGRIATAQCQTKINGAISTFISKIIKPKPPVVTQVTKNICDCQVQKAIDETEELYNETQNEPTTQNIVQTGVAVAPAGLVLTLGLDSTAKFFLWSSVILTNFFLIAALFLMFMYVSRNYSRKDE